MSQRELSSGTMSATTPGDDIVDAFGFVSAASYHPGYHSSINLQQHHGIQLAHRQPHRPAADVRTTDVRPTEVRLLLTVDYIPTGNSISSHAINLSALIETKIDQRLYTDK